MGKCTIHKCETKFEVVERNKSVEYCPKCRKETTDRLFAMFPVEPPRGYFGSLAVTDKP